MRARSRHVRARAVFAGALIVLALAGTGVGAQAPAAQAPPQVVLPTVEAVTVEASNEVATLTYFNRPILQLRARVLGRLPHERVPLARLVMDELVAGHGALVVGAREVTGGVLIGVGPRVIVTVTPPDVDELAGETVQSVAAKAVARAQQALNEAAEARRPAALLRGAVLSLGALVIAALLVWALLRVRRFAADRLTALAERTAARSGIADREALRASRLLDLQSGAITFVTVVLLAFVAYSALTFILEQFPYTRPWGESLVGFLVGTAEQVALGILSAIPGLFTVFVIFMLTRVAVRLTRLWFDAVERGRIRVLWVHPETAQPSRRLTTALLWMFAIIMAYPYLPGSDTDAFKGVSVFLGLMVTLGSSGIVNQIMSGFMVMYSRALKVGHYVRIGEVEGTVTQLGVLSTKIRTLLSEEITVPNAVVVSQTTTDYSRLADTVLTPTTVTIGYDAPWRQVHALLTGAADRTAGLRREPKPHVFQTALDDFYVRYTLYVALERQESRLVTMDALHANIQDLFNEYGVQIMSPNYMLDPAAPKVVAKQHWFAAPAKPDSESR